MFVMFDMYVKLPPDASPIAVNKFYLFTYLLDSLKVVCSSIGIINIINIRDSNLAVTEFRSQMYPTLKPFHRREFLVI